ncbi:MAG: phospholipid/cholesterol/gamma-HCH transport system substrate-binding protein [Solirubrobacterales bacterium]|jgi:ABC-type transporter Mla subunit MlaD|nr:phospholipid/cholesterol/gamma-HCH transport system substrate-binding protein [Solirubrobacterales bacterium]
MSAPNRTRLSARVGRFTSRLDNHKTLLGLIVLGVGAFLGYVAFVSTTGPPFQPKYEIKVNLPADAPVVREGQAVRVGGKLAGLISQVEPDREEGGTTVTANITKTEFRPMPEDTEAYVRVHSIVYETYLELLPGSSETNLENGDSIGSPAASGTDLLEVVQLFDAEARESLRETTVNAGFGVAGRGNEVNAALADLDGMARRLEPQLEAITEDEGALADAIEGAANTTDALRGESPDDVEALIESGNATVGTIAGREAELRRTLQLLRPFEDQFLETAPLAEPLLNDAEDLAKELQPTFETVSDRLPALAELLNMGDVLREEIPALTAVVDPTLVAARPVIYGLFPTMTALGPLNANLKLLKATVDPYKKEIAQAGKRLGNATSHVFDKGLAPGTPAGRVVPVLTPHTCTNPIPDPGEAQGDEC